MDPNKNLQCDQNQTMVSHFLIRCQATNSRFGSAAQSNAETGLLKIQILDKFRNGMAQLPTIPQLLKTIEHKYIFNMLRARLNRPRLLVVRARQRATLHGCPGGAPQAGRGCSDRHLCRWYGHRSKNPTTGRGRISAPAPDPSSRFRPGATRVRT